jgi:HPt (histidine-containing phosphotransfer) domain-containing protein
MPRQISILQSLVTAGEMTAIMQQAHGIKGAAINVGAIRLMEAAYKIETAATERSMDALVLLMPMLNPQFEALKVECEKIG